MKFIRGRSECVHYTQLRGSRSTRRINRNYTILIIFIAILIFIISCIALWRLLRRRSSSIDNQSMEINCTTCFNSTTTLNEKNDTSTTSGTSSTVQSDLLTTSKTNGMGICTSATWATNGITAAGGAGPGANFNQLKYPRGAFVDDTGAIYITDDNLRVMKWERRSSKGVMVAGFGGRGRNNDQFEYYLHNLAVDKEGTIFVCDNGNRRVMRWEKNAPTGEVVLSNINCFGVALDDEGSLYVSNLDQNLIVKHRQNSPDDDDDKIVAGGNGKGDALNQFDRPHFPFVDQNFNLFVPDTDNHRIMKWAAGSTEGIIVSQDDSLTLLRAPHAVVVDQMETIYIVDHDLHQVVRWFKDAESGEIIFGGQGLGNQPNQFAYPIDIDFDSQGNLYITDRNNHRIQMYIINKTSCH